MSKEPSHSFFSKIINLFSSKKEDDKTSSTTEPSDEKIEELIQNVLSIKDSIVKEIMIPRVNISFVRENNSLEEVLKIVKDTKHSRYPVFSSDTEKVVGILHVKDLLNIKNHEDFHILNLVREPKYTPETKSVTALLEDFKKDRAHLAMVLDEYGVLAGLITIEDILEEIVGEIEDEFYEEKNNEIIKINEKEYIVSSIIEKEKFEDFFDVELDCPDAESLGGFVLKEFGHLPKVGESIKVSNLELIITSADQRKIKKLTVRKIG